MRNRLFLIGLVLLLASLICAAQGGPDIKQELLHQTIVVRGYYTAPVLRYDQNGSLLPSDTTVTGFGVSDGSIYVTDVRLSEQLLTIVGQRTVQVYNRETKHFQPAASGPEVALEIALPADRPASTSVPALLKQVLITTAEQEKQCTAEERDRFPQLLSPMHDKPGKAQTLAELPSYCFPTGEKAYRVASGVTPPESMSTPDPKYPDDVRRESEAAQFQGRQSQHTAMLLIIVDQQGRPSTFYVLRSPSVDPAKASFFDKASLTALDKATVAAVRKWLFKPATFHGTPVPVAINVIVNLQH